MMALRVGFDLILIVRSSKGMCQSVTQDFAHLTLAERGLYPPNAGERKSQTSPKF